MVAVSENTKPDERPAVKPAPRGYWLVKFAPFAVMPVTEAEFRIIVETVN